MLRNLRSRRRTRHGVFLCVVVSGLLLLVCVSVYLFHRRATVPHPSHHVNFDSLLSDSVNDDYIDGEDTIDTIDTVDAIDTIDTVDAIDTIDGLSAVEEESEDTIDADEEEHLDENNTASGYFFHHVEGVIRRAISKSSFMDEDDDGPFVGPEDGRKTAFSSDDVAVEEKVRSKAFEVKGIEDALMLKSMGRRVSPLREGWGDWFDKKGDFLKKDKMLRSSFERLNPLYNSIIQDPDALGITGITKSDKIVRNFMLHDLKRVPFPSRKITHQSNF